MCVNPVNSEESPNRENSIIQGEIETIKRKETTDEIDYNYVSEKEN